MVVAKRDGLEVVFQGAENTVMSLEVLGIIDSVRVTD